MDSSTIDVRSVPEKIAELSAAHPHRTALSLNGRSLTYSDLSFHAELFATYLIQFGVASGDTVAICLERSFDWIIAALGSMRAGAAYVPLDPAWPDARLQYAVRDSGATVLVAPAALLNRLQVEARGIDPSSEAKSIARAEQSLRKPVSPEQLAYIIYTSGSSGNPKGVEIEHASLMNLIAWHGSTFRVVPEDRVSHLLGLGFDASVLEIWPHLCAGATLCFIDEDVRSSPELTRDWMIRERVTIGIVPAVLGAHLIAMQWPPETALRLLIVGGDALLSGPHTHLPFQVVNQYGPTECTVVSTYAVLEPGMAGLPPIGREITGAAVHLLDEHGQPVPDGLVGEIYIGGNVVGRGYRNLPDLTERTFLPDPFSLAARARMYRTGDRAFRRPDGQLEFCGRLDRQTKIRGHRIELDEIGNVLMQHPSVAFAAAVATQSSLGETQLVAHLLMRPETHLPTPAELQRHMQASLPDYMVPAVFVRMQALPISPNGKLDLNLLLAPAEANLLERTTPERATANTFASPIEEKLLAIVRELLRKDDIAVGDDFFLAGGHSLLGTQLVLRIQQCFGIDLALRQLFDAATVESLAVVVEKILIEAVDSMSDEEAEQQFVG